MLCGIDCSMPGVCISIRIGGDAKSALVWDVSQCEITAVKL